MFIQLIQSGRFAFILDGYDEVPANRIGALNKGLTELISASGNSSVILTSRPDDTLEYLRNFSNYKVLPLNLDQAKELIGRLDYDSVVKGKFLENLEKGLFKKHSDFLSNPLLLTILLMTYGEIAEIPSKIHIFYEQAFDVLFYKHDASKGMFRRETKSGLAIDDFKMMLACISASGSIRGKSTYTSTDLIEFIRKGKKITGLKSLKPEDFKTDLLTTVSILVHDGNRYSYTHRSFQEYFSAHFLVKIKTESTIDLCFKYLERWPRDNVLHLAFEMDSDTVEQEFIYPALQAVFSKCGDDPIKHLKDWSDGFDLQWIRRRKGKPNRGFYGLVHPKPNWGFLRYLETIYAKEQKRFCASSKRILTQKRFIQVVGSFERRRKISVRNLSKEGKDALIEIGIVEHAQNRIKFLRSIKSLIEAKQNNRASSKFDEWL